MAAWTGSRSQQQVEDLWEGFASAHTWIYVEHSWWQLIPRLVEAAAPAGSDRLGFQLPCHVVTAYNPGGRAAADVDNRAAAQALGADSRLDGLIVLPSVGGHPDGAGWSRGSPSSACPGGRPGRWDEPMVSSRSTNFRAPPARSSPAVATTSSPRLSSAIVGGNRPARCHRRRHNQSWVLECLLRERGRGCGGGQVQRRPPRSRSTGCGSPPTTS